jgi:tight adherence protein B
MGALLGLCFGAGAVLAWSAWAVPRAAASAGGVAPDGTGSSGRLRALLDAAGLPATSGRTVVLVCLACGVVAAVLLQVASRTPPVALAFGVLGGYLPLTVVRGRARRRQRELAEVWPEAVDNLASAVRAGMSLPEAVVGLARRGPDPLRPAFAGFAIDYQVTGRFADSLDRLKARLADPVGDQVVESLRVAREVGGGDLGRLLRSLSAFLRDDARTRAELESRQAWTVNGARLAVAAPWLVLLMLCFQPTVIHRYASPAGVVVIAAGAACCLVAYRLMLRLGRLPEDRRVLS